MERLYYEHKNVIQNIASFYQHQGLRMMLPKGYGESMNYSITNHQPIGGKQLINILTNSDISCGAILPKSCLI